MNSHSRNIIVSEFRDTSLTETYKDQTSKQTTQVDPSFTPKKHNATKTRRLINIDQRKLTRGSRPISKELKNSNLECDLKPIRGEFLYENEEATKSVSNPSFNPRISTSNAKRSHFRSTSQPIEPELIKKCHKPNLNAFKYYRQSCNPIYMEDGKEKRNRAFYGSLRTAKKAIQNRKPSEVISSKLLPLKSCRRIRKPATRSYSNNIRNKRQDSTKQLNQDLLYDNINLNKNRVKRKSSQRSSQKSLSRLSKPNPKSNNTKSTFYNRKSNTAMYTDHFVHSANQKIEEFKKDKRIIDAIKDFVQKRGLKQRNISDEEINSDITKIRDSKVLNYNKYNEPTFHILENITKAKPIYASKAKLEDNSRNKPCSVINLTEFHNNSNQSGNSSKITRFNNDATPCSITPSMKELYRPKLSLPMDTKETEEPLQKYWMSKRSVKSGFTQKVFQAINTTKQGIFVSGFRVNKCRQNMAQKNIRRLKLDNLDHPND
ncbi:unnamed protein product [Moneuplotes crassus]|uniref:Uncharacterized protein n=1 Tax=Euplotes crassus TaxID=5936 RepID=A0AAD2DAR3_EUPCR|nr:unnamed protein product [Moneuplotes crassus]